jgi:uncharacterized protein YndB with AHSA1/START domain
LRRWCRPGSKDDAGEPLVQLFIYIQAEFFLRVKDMQITVETIVKAPVEAVWAAYTRPEDIRQWNAASDDWHTTQSSVDLRVGGAFSSRMEAKDGSFGFDFAGTYTKVVPNECLGYAFGDRNAKVDFINGAEGVTVRVTFDAESQHPLEQQRQGWQAILNNFTRHVEAAKP